MRASRSAAVEILEPLTIAAAAAAGVRPLSAAVSTGSDAGSAAFIASNHWVRSSRSCRVSIGVAELMARSRIAFRESWKSGSRAESGLAASAGVRTIRPASCSRRVP